MKRGIFLMAVMAVIVFLSTTAASADGKFVGDKGAVKVEVAPLPPGVPVPDSFPDRSRSLYFDRGFDRNDGDESATPVSDRRLWVEGPSLRLGVGCLSLGVRTFRYESPDCRVLPRARWLSGVCRDNRYGYGSYGSYGGGYSGYGLSRPMNRYYSDFTRSSSYRRW